MITNNSLANAKAVFQKAPASLPEDDKVRMCSSLAEYHYEAALKLSDVKVSDNLDDIHSISRKCASHCREGLLLGEQGLHLLVMLEDSAQISFMLHHLRLLLAVALTNLGDLKSALKEVALLPDWKNGLEEYQELGFDQLLLQVRIHAMLGNDDSCCLCIQELASFLSLKNISSMDGLKHRLSDAFADVLKHWKRELGNNGLVDSLVVLMKASTMGVEAILDILKMLPEWSDTGQLSVRVDTGLILEIISCNDVCNLFLQNPDHQQLCWSIFQKMASCMYLMGAIDEAIVFQQACLHYGPESKKQWSFALLFGLYTRQKNFKMAKQCQLELRGNIKEHALVTCMKVIGRQENSESKDKSVERMMSSEMLKDSAVWNVEYLHAIKEISTYYNLDKHVRSEDPIEVYLSHLQSGNLVMTDEIMDMIEAAVEESLHVAQSVAEKSMMSSSKIINQSIDQAQGTLDIVLFQNSVDEYYIRLLTAAHGFVRAALCALAVNPPTSDDNISTLIDVLNIKEAHILMLLCHQYLDFCLAGESVSMYVDMLQDMIEECEQMPLVDSDSEKALIIIKLRLAIFMGDDDAMNQNSFEFIESIMGEEPFLDFLCLHLTSSGLSHDLISPATLQYMSLTTCGNGLERLIEYSSASQSEDQTYRLLCRALPHCVVGSAILLCEHVLAHEACSDRMQSKVYFLFPWSFKKNIEDLYSSSQCLSLSETSLLTGDAISQSVSEVESPPAKDMKTAKETVESLVDQLASQTEDDSSPLVPDHSPAEAGMWGTWIKKVLNRGS